MGPSSDFTNLNTCFYDESLLSCAMVTLWRQRDVSSAALKFWPFVSMLRLQLERLSPESWSTQIVIITCMIIRNIFRRWLNYMDDWIVRNKYICTGLIFTLGVPLLTWNKIKLLNSHGWIFSLISLSVRLTANVDTESTEGRGKVLGKLCTLLPLHVYEVKIQKNFVRSKDSKELIKKDIRQSDKFRSQLYSFLAKQSKSREATIWYRFIFIVWCWWNWHKKKSEAHS